MVGFAETTFDEWAWKHVILALSYFLNPTVPIVHNLTPNILK